MPTPTPTHMSSPGVAVSSVPRRDVVLPSVSPTNVASTGSQTDVAVPTGSPAVPSVSPTDVVSSTETTPMSPGMSSNVSSIVFDCFCPHVVQCRRNHLCGGRGGDVYHLICHCCHHCR